MIIFSSLRSFTYAIMFATPYILTGLSVIFAYKAGIFNIGVEGQYVIGGIATLFTAVKFGELPPYVLIPLCMIVAVVASGLWGALIAFLNIKFKVNNIISMIMFNWIALYLSNFIIENCGLLNLSVTTVSVDISKNANMRIPKQLISDMKLCNATNVGIIIAILMAFLVYFILEKTTIGYEVKSVGLNSDASKAAGMKVNRIKCFTLSASAMLAGLGGALQLMGMSKRLCIYTSQEGYGFGGIVVALTAFINPILSIFTGLIYGAMKYSSRALNLVGIPTQVIDAIVGFVVYIIAILQILKERKK